MNVTRATSRHDVLPPRGNLRLCVNNASSTQAGRPLFHAAYDFAAHITDTNEALATVPLRPSMAGATLHSIPLPGYPGSLPPNFIQINHVAHVDGSKVSVSRKHETIRRTLACVQTGFAK